MFDSLYFDASYFEVLLPEAGGGAGDVVLSESAYFDCDYFDPTYFATDCVDTPEPVVGGGRGGRVVAPNRRRPLVEDPDELLALI